MTWTDILTGGLAVGALAATLAFLRQHIAIALRTFIVEIDVRGWDEVIWLSLWLSHIEYGKRCRKLATRTIEHGDESDMVYEPGLGLHLFRFEGVWVLINRQVEKDENVWNRREWYSVRVLGSRNVATKLLDVATEGRILVITTNDADALNPALKRPGRLDVHVHIGYVTRDQARRLFLRFHPGREHEAALFAAALPENELSAAAIQEYLVARRDDSARALAEARLLATMEVRAVERGEEAA